MFGLLLAFFSSFVATLLIIRFKDLHSHLSADSDLNGPQKFHKTIVPRIGGISIALGILTAIIVKMLEVPQNNFFLLLLLSAAPTFFIGLTEDLTKKISARLRLFFTVISSVLFVFLLQTHIERLDISILDYALAIPIIGTFFTIFAVTGLTNAYNIIDGFNGLASMVGILTLLAIAYVAFLFQDMAVIYPSLIMVGAILGFFVWNYPRGLIFLGDGGAYLIGFWIACLSVLIVSRHSEISPWFALMVNAYPIMETLYTVYRRKLHQEKSPGQPDGIHLHTLIYRRVLVRGTKNHDLLSVNAGTAPYFWVLAGFGIAPALLWWNSTTPLVLSCFGFIACYMWGYTRIVKFKTPKWLHF